MIDPGWGSCSPSPDDDGHGGADNPGQEGVGQRPQPVQEVEAVKVERRSVSAGERAAPLPAALRYGKEQETRPIFARTLCHSHANSRTGSGVPGLPLPSPTSLRP